MGIKDTLFGLAANIIIERPAKKQTYDELAERLIEAGKQIEQKVTSTQDSPANREQMRHIIGIERWGQRRLRTTLGEPAVTDEYHSYAPSSNLTVAGLRKEWTATRAETVTLARSLGEINATQMVPHNDFGPLTPRGWLVYLMQHATRESGRLK